MISRSSSTYKPLADRPNKAGDPELANGRRDHEMTHISVLPPTESVVLHQNEGNARAQHKLLGGGGGGGDLYDGLPPKTRGRDGWCNCTWTNFHCILCLGVCIFFIFWIFLLLRMYLPLESGVMTWWLGEKPSPKKQQ